jgi:hypothetical protein
MNTGQQALHTAWTRYADLIHLGRCDVCGRNRDKNSGRLLLVARQQRRTELECIYCWLDRTTAEADGDG